jgi:uncharacterized protein
MTTDELLTTAAILGILDEFATAGHVLPRAALKQAADRWPEVGPVLLAKLEDAADRTDRSERTQNILLFGVYLMAQLRETQAYRPLCTLAADGDWLTHLLEDGITEDLSAILARVYDGDQAPLRSLIEAVDANEFTRDAALGALARLTATGQIDRDETARYLRDLHTTLQPRDTCWVWSGLQDAIANLGLDDLVPLVEDVFTRGWIDKGWLDVEDFHESLRIAREATDPVSVFKRHNSDDGGLDDVADNMSRWLMFQPLRKPSPAFRPAPAAPRSSAQVHNPYRNVGRNDPCPCGSGKKFKKCCLDKMR